MKLHSGDTFFKFQIFGDNYCKLVKHFFKLNVA